jgi:hypothetical protein
LLLAGGLAAGLQLPRQAEGPSATTPPPLASDTFSHVVKELETNYWELYPKREAIVLESIERLSEGVGFRLRLSSDMEGFSHLLHSTNDVPFRESFDGTVTVRFEDGPARKVQRATTRIEAVSDTGNRSRTYTVDVDYYPKEHYAASGRIDEGHGRVIVRNTDLALSTGRVEDWDLQTLTAVHREYAKRRWGHLIDPDRSDYENARALARTLVDDLHLHRGVPSNEMDRMPPFDQYQRVLAGKDRVWCSNISRIFVDACSAFGIPCRIIDMRHQFLPPPQDGDGVEVLLAEGHSTTEVFSRQHNRWIWLDLTFQIWAAYLGQEGPINVPELHRYLNDPVRLESLHIVTYEPGSRRERRLPVMRSSKKDLLLSYFKQDQRFLYTKRVRQQRGQARP